MPAKRKLPREGTQDSPYSKRSRRTKPNQTDIAERILESIKSRQKDDGSLLASSFLKVPSKRQNPEYHEIVQEPIDLTRITQRMRMDEYRDIESLTADMDLLVSNAKKYYEEDSTEYQDAISLWESYIDTKTAIFSSEGEEDSLMTMTTQSAASTPASDDLFNKLDDIYNSLLAEVDEEGHGLTDMFLVLPDGEIYPDYYEKIKDPIDLTMIGEKIQNKQYKSLSEFERDVKQLIKNARFYNEPNSKIYNNATTLKNALQDRLMAEAEKIEKPDPGVKTSARIKQRNSAKFDGDGGLKRQDAVDLPESSVRSSRATILHQASITEKTLKGKEGIHAKLYNEIVNFRNALGHCISDAFVRLPNKRHYPEYYEEIDQPISLKTIRRNILGKKYKTSELLAEDFRLLFKNAKQYNQEQSLIYKNAQTLLDMVEQKLPNCIKLEEELEDTDDEEEEESEDEEMEEEEEEDEEEEESEDEQDAPSTPDSKKSRKKKEMVNRKQRGSGQKEKPLEIFRKNLRLLYDAVLDGSYEGRSMIGLFMEKPSRKDYPDYYKLILEPIDMKMIDKKIRQEKYPTIHALVEDFNLMFTNARHYNEPGSEVYQDAERLQEILKKKLEELPPLPGYDGGPTATIKAEILPQKSNPLLKNMEQIYKKIREYRDVTGREICEIFNKLPSKSELPDYYQVIKKPMDSDRIMQKMHTSSYSTLSEFMTDIILMFENACTYNEPGSLIYKDALILQKIAVDACEEVAGLFKNPDVQSHVQELLTNLFVSVINHQDEDGRCYSDSLSTSPLTKQEPTTQPSTEGEPTSTSSNTQTPEQMPDETKINFDTIRRNLHAKRYTRLDIFQEHMFQVFETARKSNRTDCEVYEDAVELQKFFIRIRDELCKNGEILTSSALRYTAKQLQVELDTEKQEKLPAEALEDEAGKEEGKEMREKVETATASEGMDVQGVTYQPGDFVYVQDTAEAGTSQPPHIACIEKLYQNESGEQMMYGVWFYRPQDTYHLQTRKFLIKEVFKSDYYNTLPVSCIKGKCFVMMAKDYFKQKPVGYVEDDVYVCVSRYSSRMKSFKQIKLLNLPLNNTKIIQRDKPLVAIRVSSVYSENAKNDIPKLSDMHGPLVTDNIPWPDTPIVKQLPIVKVENATPDPTQPAQQTFYLQYIINNMVLKVGDHVYVQQSGVDQRLKIALIESMWSDINSQMWFQGSWFAQPCETEHEPTRMFYKNEVFLLSFNSANDEPSTSMPPPNPLSWIVGKCAVLSVRDVAQCRPTEISEMHIHVCESRYLAADKTIRKIKGALKKPAITNKVAVDECYYFKKLLEVPREISPQLASTVRIELKEREDEMNREQEEENRRKALEAQNAAGMVMAPQYPQQQMNPMMQPRPYPVQQQQYQAYQQPQYQQQPQYMQPQYMVPPNQPQPVPVQQPHYQQYQPGTPYNPHPQMHMHPGAHPSSSVAPQMQPPYQPMQGHPYTPQQPGVPIMGQSPMQGGIRQTNTPIDRVETPSSAGSATPTTTKKKPRGGHSTGYILFASECHPRMRAENPTMPFGEISKLVGEEWRSQTDEKKREYEERARELTAKAEAEGRPMQGKKKKKQAMRREMEEAAAAAQQQQQQQQQQQAQQHPPPPPRVMVQQQMPQGMVQQPPYVQGQYIQGQYPAPQPGYQQQIPGTPQHVTPQQYPGQTPQLVSTPTPVAIQPGQGQVYATPAGAPDQQQPASGMRRGPLFVKPPPKVQRVLHSEAYLRYIEGLEKGQRTISNFEKTLVVEEKDVHLGPNDMARLPGHWLANGKGRHESVKSALWSLRDLMLKDALALKNHFT